MATILLKILWCPVIIVAIFYALGGGREKLLPLAHEEGEMM